MPASVASSGTSRALDPRAVDAIVRRLAGQEDPPWLHREAARRMAERLPLILRQPQSVIDWSGWLGGSEQLLRDAYPQAQRRTVECDPLLLSAGQKRAQAPWWSPRRWTGAAPPVAPQSVEASSSELVWANMLLQAASDPPVVMAQWQRALKVDGFLMFSTLGPGTLPELRALYAEHGWGPPMADFVDMHDLGDMLVQAGFADPVMDQETLTLTFATPDAALAELRSLGGNAAPARFSGLRTPRWRSALLQALRQAAEPSGRISLRFELVYGHAFRPAPKPRVQARTEVSLEAMRDMVRSGRPVGDEGPSGLR